MAQGGPGGPGGPGGGGSLIISGPPSVTCGLSSDYTVSGGSGTVTWEAFGGTITASNNTSATVNWTGSSGSLIAEIVGSSTLPGLLNVTINGPTAPTVTSGSGCPNTAIILTASTTVKWYSASTGGTLLSTGSTYIHNGTTSKTVYAAAYNSTCESVRVAVTATVNNCGGGTPMLNYVKAYTVQEPGHTTLSSATSQATPAEVLRNTSYSDGLGRGIQNIAWRATPDQKDLVSTSEYDDLGRNLEQWLPFKSTGNNGTYKGSKIAERNSFYLSQYGSTDDGYAYTKIETNGSPSNRPLEQFAPGQSWVGSGRGAGTVDYRSNISSEYVVRWNAGTGETSVPTFAGYYTTDKLSVVETADEQGKWVMEYTDFLGRVILKKVADSSSPGINHTGWLSTYYVYDIYGNLKTVIPPKAVDLISNDWSINATESSELLFHYYYDYRNRLVVKKVPGANKTEMVYDQQDRLVLSRDGAQTSKSKWVFTKYDHLGRSVMGGTYDGSTSRSSLQSTINSDDSAFEVRKTSASGYTLQYNYYVKAFGSLSSLNIESVIYYDDYSFTGETIGSAYANMASGGAYAEPYSPSPNVNGLVTGTKIKTLGESTWSETINFYNTKARVIQTMTFSHLGGEDIVSYNYDFSGRMLNSYVVHYNPNAVVNQLNYKKTYTYDAVGRLSAITQQEYNTSDVAQGSPQTLASNTYDALGQLTQKALGNNKQYVDYSYNIRGWLKGINDPSNLGTDYFAMKLKYNDASTAVDMFNGNIAEVEWKSTGDAHLKRYEYSYDRTNRLTGGYYRNLSASTYNNDYSVSGVTYDPNGNIMTLTRRGRVLNAAKDIDVLNYDYYSSEVSNKLRKVTDTGVKGKIGDFLDNANLTNEYTYDASGNMTRDHNKGMAADIAYNRFNLPEDVNMGSGRTISYRYDAGGSKLQKITNDNGTIVTTDYVSGFIYQNNKLQHFAHEEGRVRKNDQGALVYDYVIKDHLGNTRSTFTTETAPAIVYKATMETENDNQGNNIAAFEEQLFFNMDLSRYAYTAANQSTLADDGCTSCNEVSRTNGSLTNNRVGAAILLDVMAGDEVDMEVWAYNQGGISTSTSRVSSSTLVAALVNAFVPGGAGTDLYTQTNSVFNGVSTYLTGGGSSGTSTPFAFLNYIVFDSNFTRIASGHQRVSSVANAKHLLNLNNINITQKGYIYIWVSNESNEAQNTFFDDLKITHNKGAILQEDHYYPFGMNINALSSTAPLSKPNQFKFNGNEEQTDFDFNVFDFNARFYDGALGRFMNIDPLADVFTSYTPYHFTHNNPINLVDPTGMSAEGAQTSVAEDRAAHDAALGNDPEPEAGNAYAGNGGTDPESNNPFSLKYRRFSTDYDGPTVEELTYKGNFVQGLGNGVADGATDTWGFLKSLATLKGWKSLLRGFESTVDFANPFSPTGQIARQDASIRLDRFADASSTWTSYDWGYGTGYGLEKGIEGALVTKSFGALPRLKWLRAPGGDINGFTISKGSGYGARSRLDFHKLSNSYNSRATSRMTIPERWDGKKLLHYHRGKGNNIRYHRPWEIGPDGKRRW